MKSLSPKGREALTFAVPPLLVFSTISIRYGLSLAKAIPWVLVTLPLRQSLLVLASASLSVCSSQVHSTFAPASAFT